MSELQKAAEVLINDGYHFLPLDNEARAALSATLHAGYEFFRSPLDEKLKNTLLEDCGYRPWGVEYSRSPEEPDQMESFTATARDIDTSGLGTEKGRSLYRQMRKTIAVLEPIAESLAIALARKVAADADTSQLAGAFHEWTCLQLNYSRPAENATRLINAPHEDGNLVTLGVSDGPGLEIQTPEGSFLPVRRPEGTIVVMPGEIARLLSGGMVRPLFHQVRPDPGVAERLALLYFGDIDPARCEPWVQNEVNQDIDIGAISRANSARFGLEGFVAD
jgi:isopenicillin N synthase-like dioxygenase